MDNNTNLSTSIPWPDGALYEHWVESLFAKMTFTYGTRFLDQWRGIDTSGVKRHWGIELATLTNEQLRLGVAKLSTRQWPPTLPEFVAMCKPPLDPVVAFHEAVEQGARRERGDPDEWSSPAIFWAWRKIGAYDFAHQAYAALKPRWEAALAAEMAKERLEPVPAQMVALPAPGRTLTSSDKAHALLAEFRHKGMGTLPVGDGRDWARAVLARRASLSIGVVHAAEQALGMR